MLRTYITIAARVLLKNKLFSGINILGLSVGIAFVLLIAAYSWGELQVNSIVKENHRVFLVQSKWKQNGMGLDFTTLAPLSKTLKQEYPHLVEEQYHWDGIRSIVSKDNKFFRESLLLGDPEFIPMFGFRVLHGDGKTALNNPDNVVLTKNRAIKYFGRSNVVGERLTMQSFSNSKKDFVITAVLDDMPYNSVTCLGSDKNEFFFSYKALSFFQPAREAGFEQWGNSYIVNFVRLKKGVSTAQLAQPIRQVLKKYAPPAFEQNLEIYLTPLNKYYLQQNNGLAKRMIYTLSFIALFILLMAVINFINLSVGNSVGRLKEIGVRKVLGGMRRQLIVQFLTESFVLVVLSVVLALMIYQSARPLFSNFLGKEILPLSGFPPAFALVLVLLIIIIGLLAGIYPALVLSAQPSVDSLKGKLKTVREKIFFRHSLVTLQFATAIVVFTGSVIIGRQIAYFFNKDLGYDKEYVITAAVPRDWTAEGVKRMETIRNEFSNLPEVKQASFSFEIPDGASGIMSNNLYKASEDSTKGIIATSIVCDEKFAETYKLPLLAGRFFHYEGGSYDSARLVVNETAAKRLGWNDPQDAIGQQVQIQFDPRVYHIQGVIKDFHFGSMHEAIQPLVFYQVRNNLGYRYLSFQVKPGNTAATLAALQKKWSVLFPEAPFDYKFIDDTLATLYKTELQMKKAAQTATVLALIIVLLGVSGVVSLSIAKRTKELGIRKVLGASVANIVWLFLKEFSGITLIALCVAWPVTYLVLKQWLANYAYRISLTATPFITAGLCLVALVCALIAIQTIGKAMASPVRNLRTE